MAQMFPEKIPQEVLEDEKRNSEVEVYNALKKQLDSSYYVYYSSPWLGTNKDGSEIDGEADFLIAHAEQGLLSVEVKGGRVEIGSDGKWTSTDRYGFKRNVKDPVKQARTSKHKLLEKLKASRQWQPRFICARHGVILPHVKRPPRDLRPDMPLKIFAFDRDMKYLDKWVEARFQSSEDDQRKKVDSLGEDGLEALYDMLARPIKLEVRLGRSLADDLKDINLKTNDQIFILREMEANKRMAICGAAGTGKTILAIEKAIMLATEQKRVLLMCFNKPLSIKLKQTVQHIPLIETFSFYQFCWDLVVRTGKDKKDYTHKQLADHLVDFFVEAELEEYDAIIIDEGQDFKEEWLLSLEVIVKDGENGVLYIFYDDNQNVMSTSAPYLAKLPVAKHQLTRNFRNTKTIFEEAEAYYKGGYVRSIGPVGNSLGRCIVKGDKDLKNKIASRIDQLIKIEKVSLNDIAILCPTGNYLEKFKTEQGFRIRGFKCCDAEENEPEKVILDSIRRFKGLESPVVFLILDSITSSNVELLYTAITRAQGMMEIFAEKHVIHNLEKTKGFT